MNRQTEILTDKQKYKQKNRNINGQTEISKDKQKY